MEVCIVTCGAFQVSVGEFLSETLDDPLTYTEQTQTELPLEIIIPAVGGSLLVVIFCSVFIVCCVVCYHNKKSKKSEQRWTNLLSQMELMELEMADECKRGKCVCCLLYTSPSPRDATLSRMPSSA